jgi:hypothetical protein
LTAIDAAAAGSAASTRTSRTNRFITPPPARAAAQTGT